MRLTHVFIFDRPIHMVRQPCVATMLMLGLGQGSVLFANQVNLICALPTECFGRAGWRGTSVDWNRRRKPGYSCGRALGSSFGKKSVCLRCLRLAPIASISPSIRKYTFTYAGAKGRKYTEIKTKSKRFGNLPPLNLLCIYRPTISRYPVGQLGNPSASLVDLH